MEENQKPKPQDEEVKDEELEEDDDENESEGSSSKSFLNKYLGKYTRKIKRSKKKTTKYLIAIQQVILFVILIIVFLAWPLIEKGLHFLSGLETINIVSKTQENGCFEVVTLEGASYCVDEESYNLVDTQGEYQLQKQQYDYKLRR